MTGCRESSVGALAESVDGPGLPTLPMARRGLTRMRHVPPGAESVRLGRAAFVAQIAKSICPC
jgi:hypothetical protein